MKNLFSKIHTWLRFLMLMFVCVAWAGPTYAEDKVVSFDFTSSSSRANMELGPWGTGYLTNSGYSIYPGQECRMDDIWIYSDNSSRTCKVDGQYERLYMSGSAPLIIENVDENYQISKVDIIAKSTFNMTAPAGGAVGLDGDDWKVHAKWPATFSDSDYEFTWTENVDPEMSLTFNSTGTTYIAQIIVTLTSASVELTPADIAYTSLHESPAQNYTSLASDVLSFAKNVSIYNEELHATDEAGNQVGVVVDGKNLNLTFSPAFGVGEHTVTFPEGMIKVGNNYNNAFSVNYTVTEVTAADMNPYSQMQSETYYSLSSDCLFFDGPVSIYNSELKALFDGEEATVSPYGYSLYVYVTETTVPGEHTLVIPTGMLLVGGHYNNEIVIQYNIAAIPELADLNPTSEKAGAENLYSINGDVLTFSDAVSIFDYNMHATIDGNQAYVYSYGNNLNVSFSEISTPGVHTLTIPEGMLQVGNNRNKTITINYTLVKDPNGPDATISLATNYGNSSQFTATDGELFKVTAFAYNGYANLYWGWDITATTLQPGTKIAKAQLVAQGSYNLSSTTVNGSSDDWNSTTYTWEGTPTDQLVFSYPGDVFVASIKLWLHKATLYNINVSNSIENGSVSVSTNKAEAGDVITLTAIPDFGYQFASWSVTSTANGTPIEVVNDQFTMPEEDVTVSATFEEKGPIIDYYSNTLARQELFEEFFVIDANNDYKTWTFNNSNAKIGYNQYESMNDYLVTPGITITGGKYRISVDMAEASETYPERFEIVCGIAPSADALTNVIIGATIPTTYFQTYTEEFEISTPGVYYFAIHGISDADESSLYAKNFVFEKVAEEIAISAAGWATYVAPCDLDFTDNAIEAYAVSAVSATSVTLSPLTTVPAGEAILVKGETGYVPVAASAAPISNLLVAATAPVTATGSEYVLAKQEGNVVFAPVKAGVVIPEGKAYLTNLSGAASLRIDIEGMEDGMQTGISEINADANAAVMFDLQGRRIKGNGLMIQNGKVVLVK